MFKKLFTYAMALVLGLQPLLANAADLGAAFSNIVAPGAAASVTAPGAYTAGARNLFIGGGVEARFPRSNATLFSVAPPSFSAGCGGISATFGGFSFISGKEIEQLVKNIAQGAVGMVVNMVIKALCPMCEAVLQNMQHLAQFAAKSSMDSCRASAGLAARLKDYVTPNKTDKEDALAGTCGATSSATGGASDLGAAMLSVCKTMDDSVKTLNGAWKDFEDGLYGTSGQANNTSAPASKSGAVKTSADGERCRVDYGNCTWLVLKEMFPVGIVPEEALGKRLLLMNLLGTSLMSPDAKCGDAADKDTSVDSSYGATAVDSTNAPVTSVKCLPKLEPHQAVALFMCGNPVSVDGMKNKIWTNYCQSMFGDDKTTRENILVKLQGIKLMDCANTNGENSDPSRYVRCETLTTATVGTAANGKLIIGKGFLLEVQELLAEAVRRVRNNQSMTADDTGKRIISLINLAPYPLYQAINAAAVYPEAGQQLIDSLSLLVADHLAYAYFTQFLSYSTSANPAGVRVSAAMVDRLAAGMNALRMENDKSRAAMGKTLATQQLVMEEIRKVNQVIQSSVMTEQMLNMQKYANTINTSAAEPSVSGK